MIWKQFQSLVIISLIFTALFSGAWYYSNTQNSNVTINAQIILNFKNNYSSSSTFLTFPVLIQIVSYGYGGAVSYYDGVRINGTFQPKWSALIIYINSTKASNFKIEENNVTYGNVGYLNNLSLSPGFYNVTAMFYLGFYTGNSGLSFNNVFKLLSNISGNFTTIIIKPPSTVYIPPFIVSIISVVSFTVITVIKWIKFNKDPKAK